MPRLIHLLFSTAVAFFSVAGNTETFYVRNGGDDSADGLSPKTAWATIEKVNSYSFDAGDSVLFRAGDIWKGTALEIDWSGTKSQHAVVGAYHVVDGEPKRGLGEGSRPVIDGAHRVPAQHAGLVSVTGNRVRVENLRVINSEGRGIQVTDADAAQIVGTYVKDTFNSGIKLLRADGAVIKDNYVTRTGQGYIEEGADWGGAIAAVQSARPIIRNNEIVEVMGEGIGVNHNSSDALIEDNLVYGARSAGIYVDAAPRAIVRRNMVLGTDDSRYWRYERTVGPGLVLNNEKYHYKNLSSSIQAQDVSLYANVVAYTSAGIAFWGQFAETSFRNIKVYNNTFVDNEFQVSLRDKPMPGTEFVNNVFLSISAGTKDVNQTDLRGGTARSNYFSQGDPGGDFSDDGNVYAGLELERMSGWQTISSPTEVSWQDFAPKPDASIIGAGDSSLLAVASDVNQFDLDFNAKPHNEPVDMGALRYAVSKIPASPSGLVIRTRATGP